MLNFFDVISKWFIGRKLQGEVKPLHSEFESYINEIIAQHVQTIMRCLMKSNLDNLCIQHEAVMHSSKKTKILGLDDLFIELISTNQKLHVNNEEYASFEFIAWLLTHTRIITRFAKLPEHTIESFFANMKVI